MVCLMGPPTRNSMRRTWRKLLHLVACPLLIIMKEKQNLNKQRPKEWMMVVHVPEVYYPKTRIFGHS